jgi:hypothetical protein
MPNDTSVPPQRLRRGESAPDGTALGGNGQPVRLSALWANGPLLLVFLRHFG